MPKGVHGGHVRGPAHHRTNKLGVSITGQGYVKVRVGKEHPMADANGWCYLHQLVATAALGRPLAEGEHVHHKNEVRTDNRWENLTVLTGGEHSRHHAQQRRGARA